MHVNADHQRLGAEDLADFVHLLCISDYYSLGILGNCWGTGGPSSRTVSTLASPVMPLTLAVLSTPYFMANKNSNSLGVQRLLLP